MKTPGQRIAQLIAKRFASQREAAQALAISATYLSDVIAGRRGISAEMAVRLSNLFGGGCGEKLLCLQARLDYAQAERKLIEKDGGETAG